MARLIVGAVIALATIASSALQEQNETPNDQATFFHYNDRFHSRIKLERWAAQAIQVGLEDSIRTGRLRWGTMDLESTQGSALADKVGLMNKNVVLMEMRDGKMVRSKELVETWKLLRDSSAFSRYVRSETIALLKSAR
jgi:hypothetical protein